MLLCADRCVVLLDWSEHARVCAVVTGVLGLPVLQGPPGRWASQAHGETPLAGQPGGAARRRGFCCSLGRRDAKATSRRRARWIGTRLRGTRLLVCALRELQRALCSSQRRVFLRVRVCGWEGRAWCVFGMFRRSQFDPTQVSCCGELAGRGSQRKAWLDSKALRRLFFVCAS